MRSGDAFPALIGESWISENALTHNTGNDDHLKKTKKWSKEASSMASLNECEAADQFLNHPDENSFTGLFQVYSPRLVAFFRRRGHDGTVAEDLAQEVMLTVYRKAAQVRDRASFRAWLFRVARNAAHRHVTKLTREVPTVDLADVGDRLADSSVRPADGLSLEFRDWMSFLERHERDVMTLRFVENWEYHEIASAQAIPIGTVQWMVFNAKKKLAVALAGR